MPEQQLLSALRRDAHSVGLHGGYDVVLEHIGDASIVLLGEGSHGTQEFYRARAEISKRLIVEHGFDAIAVEADWPDALCVSRHVQLRDPVDDAATGEGDPAEHALGAFQRFPKWMWRNTETAELVRWLHRYNGQLNQSVDRVGFFGLDLYSLRHSMEAVIHYLSGIDPEAAKRARAHYSCFDHVTQNPQSYGYEAAFGLRKDCEDEVVQQLSELSAATVDALSGEDADEHFFAQQNARVAQNAEAYYRAMFHGRNRSWNLRDTHMADTLDALFGHLQARKGRPPRIVVWAHNSHIGDAGMTEMGEDGQTNLGELVRQRYPDSCYLLGFTTHTGTVRAASDWDGEAELKAVRPSLPNSFEHLFHDIGLGDFFLPVGKFRKPGEAALGRRLERAIGVIYRPESERISHYFFADITRQFDGVVHFDVSRALTPLDPPIDQPEKTDPETFPSGI